MKNITLLIGLIVLIMNIIVGLLVSKYVLFNVCLNSIVIIITTLLLVLFNKIEMRPAFRISLAFLFSVLGIIEIIMGLFSNGTFKDNWVIIVNVCLLAVETIFIVLTNRISRKVN